MDYRKPTNDTLNVGDIGLIWNKLRYFVAYITMIMIKLVIFNWRLKKNRSCATCVIWDNIYGVEVI